LISAAIDVGELKANSVGFSTNGEEAEFEAWCESHCQLNEVRWF
jgi:hypothetical protein